MPIKFKHYGNAIDYYKIAVINICVNAFFELALQYRFQTNIEEIYLLISILISVIAVKDITKNDNKNYLPIFYYFWPVIILFICLYSTCKLPLLPFVVSSLVILFCGRFKKKLIKIAVIVISILFFMFFCALGFILAGTSETEVIKTVYSPDNKYIMVLEEHNITPGGDVEVYIGRNIDFGLLGRYMPVKRKYYGHFGERPEFHFIDEHFIAINGKIIEIKGGNYIDDY